jgi:hypothetical protein
MVDSLFLWWFGGGGVSSCALALRFLSQPLRLVRTSFSSLLTLPEPTAWDFLGRPGGSRQI